MEMKPTVVIVDDEPTIVDVVCDVLDEANLDAVGCPHGVGVVNCITRRQPDLVILDVQMPVIDGVEVFQRLRAQPQTKDVPVIFFTANADTLRSRLPQFHEMGAELLPKPFRIDKLLDAVNRVLAN